MPLLPLSISTRQFRVLTSNAGVVYLNTLLSDSKGVSYVSHAMTLPSTLSPSSAKAASAGALALSHSSLLPGQLGNIDAYIQAVNRIPMLTPAEERQFATEFREQDNLVSARRLVLSHLRLVVAVFHKEPLRHAIFALIPGSC